MNYRWCFPATIAKSCSKELGTVSRGLSFKLLTSLMWILLACICNDADAQEKTAIYSFESKSGKVYHAVRLKSFDDQAAILFHDGGIAKVPIDEIPDSVAYELGISAEATTEPKQLPEFGRSSHVNPSARELSLFFLPMGYTLQTFNGSKAWVKDDEAIYFKVAAPLSDRRNRENAPSLKRYVGDRLDWSTNEFRIRDNTLQIRNKNGAWERAIWFVAASPQLAQPNKPRAGASPPLDRPQTDYERRVNASTYDERVGMWSDQFDRSEDWVKSTVRRGDSAADANQKLVRERLLEDYRAAGIDPY
jgi:hypothetical protein